MRLASSKRIERAGACQATARMRCASVWDCPEWTIPGVFVRCRSARGWFVRFARAVALLFHDRSAVGLFEGRANTRAFRLRRTCGANPASRVRSPTPILLEPSGLEEVPTSAAVRVGALPDLEASGMVCAACREARWVGARRLSLIPPGWPEHGLGWWFPISDCSLGGFHLPKRN